METSLSIGCRFSGAYHRNLSLEIGIARAKRTIVCSSGSFVNGETSEISEVVKRRAVLFSVASLISSTVLGFPAGLLAGNKSQPDKQDSSTNPRSFPYSVKQQCWEKAEKIKGRDPDRWRKDALGNTVFRKLVGCPGCLCHDYDHIVPYSKGGKSTLENCQVLQATVNRSKGNRTDISRADLIQRSSYCRVSGRDMDLLEMSAFGNVRRGQDSGGCIIQ